MNRIMKTLTFLTVLTVSFVYAQNEVDEVKGKDAKTIGIDDQQKVNIVTPTVKPTKPAGQKMKSHETGKVTVDKTEAIKGQKRSFFSRLFGGSKTKKEEDPN
jgi:hypothetical protein